MQAEICTTSRAVVPNIHLYPTFDEIESGQCPTVADLNKFEKLGIKYEQIFSEYFIPINKHYCPDIDSLNQSYIDMTLNDSLMDKSNAVDVEIINSNLNLEGENSELSAKTTGSTDTCKINFEDKAEKVCIVNSGNLAENITNDEIKFSFSHHINPPPGLKIEKEKEIATVEQKKKETHIQSLAEKINNLQVFIMRKCNHYPKDVVLMINRHLSDCYNVLKIMTFTTDFTELGLLRNTYVEKIKVINKAIELQQKIDDHLSQNITLQGELLTLK